MKIKKTLLAVLLMASMILPTACGGGSGKGAGGTITFWAGVSESNQTQLTAAIKAFEDANPDIKVKLVPQTADFSSNLSSTLRGNATPDVVLVDDKYFKGYVNEGYLTKLDDYIKESKNEDFNLDEMFSNLVAHFSYNPETGYSGQKESYYAVPNGNKPSLIFYNVTLFDEQKVNIVSVSNEDLEKYNADNGASLLPHGYYVYDTAPEQGMKARQDGKYHVFNNQIPMSWEELVEISKIFTQTYNSSSSSKYGFLNEWWFSHGWSVGGDCLEWEEEKGQYIFALGDENPGYLVTGEETVTVNGNEYKSGDLLTYEDKKYVAAHKSDADIAGYISSQALYELPSTREAFAEFCRLSQTTGREVDAGMPGYGISPSPTTLGNNSKFSYFTSGEVAMVCNNLDLWTVGRNMEVLGKEWDVAPLYQYKEFNADGTTKVVNGTDITGKLGAADTAEGFAIPENSKNKDAAWKFIEFMSGTKGQEILMDSNTMVPNQKELAYSDAYLKSDAKYSPANKKAIVDMASITTYGDWSYVEDGEWINAWANILNTKVRDGDMTLDEFFADSVVQATDETLKKYKAKK